MSLYDPAEIEKEVNQFWEENNIPEELGKFDDSEDKEKFYLLDGPPYANGRAHAGHALTIVFKDLWAKLKQMQGYDVWYQPGFDCHGLPIEVEVEERMGIETKQDIEEKGADEFIEKCRDFATSNLTHWMDLYKDMATWKGWLEPYLTYEDSYMESAWWTIKRLNDKGMLYQGTKPIHWCPRCQTALSGYEASDEYQDIEDPVVYLKFKVKDKNEYLLVWTTTPWTLPSNTALLVHPEKTYVRVKVGSEKYVLAKDLLEEVMDKIEAGYNVLEEFPGKELEGIKYEPLIDCPVQQDVHEEDNAHRVYLSVPIMLEHTASKVAEKKGDEEAGAEHGHLVTTDQGTGIVHIAPGHGEEDNEIGDHYDLPVLSPLDDRCHYTEGAGFEGYVKDADPEIIEWLRHHGKLLHTEEVTHSYPHCWRCKSPLIFRVSEQWFLSIDGIKPDMFDAVEGTQWLPGFAEERMHNHLEESPDWCISTQRYWGIPLPIWVCRSCNKWDVIGGKEELEDRKVSGPDIDDLHKNVVDDVVIECDNCGEDMERVPDTMTVWIDAGVGPWASLGYPHQNEELFEKLWHIDLIDESQDQIRGWFYALLFMGVATFDERPYDTVCLNGWVLDDKGEKMSKSLGNVVDAEEMVEGLGADILRLYLCTASAPWGVYKFSFEEAEKLQTHMNILLNVEKFTDMYGLELETEGEADNVANRWILSKVNRMVDEVTGHLENFEFHHAGRKMTDFLLEDFSRTYMKLSKEMDDREEVAVTLGRVMDKYLRLLAPICPYMSEYMYQQLLGDWDGTVHRAEWPEVNHKALDDEVEEAFEVLDTLSEAALALRQEEGRGLRYPVKSLSVSGPDDLTDAVMRVEEVLKELLNVKEVTVGGEEKVSHEVKLDYSNAGPKFGDDVPEIENALADADHAEIAAAVEEGEQVELAGYKLSSEDFDVRTEAETGRSFNTDLGRGTVELDMEETKEIREESLVRQLERDIQDARKEKGLDMEDKAQVPVRADEGTLDILKDWKAEIAADTGSKLILDQEPSNPKKSSFRDNVIEFEVLEGAE